MQKKVFIRSYGCQMNVRDSEVICGLLKKEGYELADEPQEADIIIFNTCSVRQHAEDKVWSEIGRFKDKKIIGLAGCMAQNYKEKAFERAQNIDFVVGPADIDNVPGIISRLSSKDKLFEVKIWETSGLTRPEEIYHTGFREDKEHAYVVISEGCSNFCSYCIVPYVRGNLHNRSYKEMLKEIEEAIDSGITKITLLGQNVNAYQHEEISFVKLIGLVNQTKGLKEFGFITSHPKDTSLDLFKAMADAGKLKKYLHLPVQSGSDRILQLMNRGYTRRYYLDLAESYRRIVKNGVLTSDIIVGFPTETQEDFEDTRSLVEEAQFEAAYIFKYSPRPHTHAATLSDNVTDEQKKRRHKIILDLQKKNSIRKSQDSKQAFL